MPSRDWPAAATESGSGWSNPPDGRGPGPAMTTIQMLTVRTNAALGRLASLQKRAARATEATAPVIRPALKELSDALEELRVANEQLQRQVDELLDSREQTQAAVERYR